MDLKAANGHGRDWQGLSIDIRPQEPMDASDNFPMASFFSTTLAVLFRQSDHKNHGAPRPTTAMLQTKQGCTVKSAANDFK